jgi:intraflagellar transport protein 46
VCAAFIPDYIPAVGEIDAFLKVPPPAEESGSKSGALALGLVVLDEPAAHQSDPTVLELSLRAVNKQVISTHATVGTIEHADKSQARVVKWIQSIEDVHRRKPPPNVHYSRPMPDIEQLMQVWPSEFEELLKTPQATLPDMTNLGCEVEAFARMVCALMDIPVYDKVTESLHVLFTLYSEFQNHAYFQH